MSDTSGGEGQVEVLFEYSDSRTAVVAQLSVLAEALETQLLKFGVIASVKLSSESGVHGENVTLIQRCDEKWQAFF